MKWKRFFSCLLCGVLLLCGCTPAANSATASHQLELVTTLFCYYDFARAILKDTDTIHLRLLLSPGMESHSFEPAPSDILAIQNADLFLYNGGHMEEWVSKVLDADEQTHPDRIVRCMMDYAPLLEEVELEGSESEHDHEHDHDGHDHDHEGESEMEYDEHIWTSPVIAKDLLYVTRDAIIQADPANAAIYQKNADAYAAQLDALNESFTDYFAEPEHRTLLFADNFRCNISPTPTDYTAMPPFRVAVPTPNPALQPSRISCIWSNLTTSRKSITWKSAVRRLQMSSVNRPEQLQPFSNPATRLHRPTSTTGKPMSA